MLAELVAICYLSLLIATSGGLITLLGYKLMKRFVFDVA